MPNFLAPIKQGGVSVSLAGHSHAGVMESGSVFPSSPAAGDLYYRTDIGDICQYDGTRWLGSARQIPIPVYNGSQPFSSAVEACNIAIGSYIYISKIYSELTVFTTNDASNYWIADYKISGTTFASANTASGAGSTRLFVSTAINAVYNAPYISVDLRKIGGPGYIFIASTIFLRFIYT
jgi:hypothetical protein